MLQRSRQHFVLPALLIAFITLFLCGLAMADTSAKKTPANRSATTTETPSTISKTWLKEIFEPGQIRDTAAFMTAALRGFPVTANALGDMNEDGVMNIRDLVRIRNISRGIGEPATPYEQAEGDFNLDLTIDQQDVLSFRESLLNMIGLPHLVDSLGGEVRGLGITATYGPGDVDSGAVIRIDDWSAAEIENYAGVDFSALADDSTYFMKGFKFESSSDNSVYPPQMKITLDNMPPCSLAGSNMLMAARRGPTGNTELVYLSELDVSADSSLSSPSPQYPELSLGVPKNEIPRTQFEPYELLQLSCSNLSQNLSANRVQFTIADGSSYWMTPISFLPKYTSSMSEVTGIEVPVPLLPPGNCMVRLLHTGVELASNSVTIEVAALHTPSQNVDSSLTLVFAKIDSFLLAVPEIFEGGSFANPPLSDFRTDFVEKVNQLRLILPELRDSILASVLDHRESDVAFIENLAGC